MDENHSTHHRAAPTAANPSPSLSTRTGTVPPVMPVLGRGKHRTPREGACLMEYVSVLAGSDFTDRPRCTAPAVARLARCVNDVVSTAGREQLARRAPALIGLHRARLPMRRIVLAELVREGLRHDPGSVLLRTVERRCRPSGSSVRRWVRTANLVLFTDSRQVLGVVLDTVRGRVPGAEAQDERLIAILDAVITRARADDLGPDVRSRRGRPGPAEVPPPQTATVT